MTKNRLEAFSDGVLAIILTIMVLELKIPHGGDLHALQPLIPIFFGYVLSFIYVGIYWNNHHHLMHAAKGIGAGVMWANLHLLFWLSLIPVVTGWVGEHPSDAWPSALYGIVLLMAGSAWLVLQAAIIRADGPDSQLARAIGGDRKGKLSFVLYALGVGVAFYRAWIAEAIYAVVALIWLIPDRRIEKTVAGHSA